MAPTLAPMTSVSATDHHSLAPYVTARRVSGRAVTILYALLLFLSAVINIDALHAESITEEQPLSFGKFAITDNNIVSTMTIPYTGLPPSITGNIIPIEPGLAGHYRLGGFPAYVLFAITVTSSNLTKGGTGLPEGFVLDNYSHHPALTANADGEALLKLGARLNSTGSGTGYVDAPYSGIITITVNW